MLKKNKFTVLFLSWVVFVTLLSLFSLPPIEREESYFNIPHIDKIVHAVFYMVMVVLGYLFVNEGYKQQFTHLERILLVMLLSLLYGIIIEVLQAMPFSTRTSEIWDAVANAVGVVVGGILAHSRILARFS